MEDVKQNGDLHPEVLEIRKFQCGVGKSETIEIALVAHSFDNGCVTVGDEIKRDGFCSKIEWDGRTITDSGQVDVTK